MIHRIENAWPAPSRAAKDLNICLEEARSNGAHLPISALIDQFYSQVQKMGGKSWDTSSLIALLNR
jgi:3-hydroxyisobutyrate dehydrogenase